MGKYRYSDEEITVAVRDSLSNMEVLRRLGMRVSGGSYGNLRRRIARLGLSTSHFKQTHGFQKGDHKKHWSQILVNRPDSDIRQNGKTLRRALIESGVPYQCRSCGLGAAWNRQMLVFDVDHINDNWTDDRKDNLRFLCPNCHSQKPKPVRLNQEESAKQRDRRKATFCASCGDLKKTSRSTLCRKCAAGRFPISGAKPPKEVLTEMLWEKPTILIAKEFGVTGNAVAKWAKAYGLSKPPRGYWAKVAANKISPRGPKVTIPSLHLGDDCSIQSEGIKA